MIDLQELNELYNILDLYIVTSRIEGGPQAILECAVSKTPIVSTDVGVASEILDSKSIFKPEEFNKAIPNVPLAFKNSQDYIIPNGMIKFKKCLKIYMKISIGSKIVDGPWGGGNLFVKNLAKYLLKMAIMFCLICQNLI